MIFDEAYDIIYLYDTHAGKCTAAKNYLDNISVKLLKHVHSSFSDMNCIVLQITMQLYCRRLEYRFLRAPNSSLKYLKVL